jgi:hypothetical protein
MIAQSITRVQAVGLEWRLWVETRRSLTCQGLPGKVAPSLMTA